MTPDALSIPLRSTEGPKEVEQLQPGILAAGVIPWRVTSEGLEILLIHRPKHQDWSLPKGKLEEGEAVAETAVREVREEVGLNVTLGIPLPYTKYHVGKKQKVVFYWAGRVDASAQAHPDGHEVDKARWYPPASALKKLTNEADTVPVRTLVDAYERDRLSTSPFFLVRHAKAKPRKAWTRSEGERPLSTTGHVQSRTLAGLLNAWRPERVVSSRWARCVQTVQPYAAATGLNIRKQTALTEHAAEQDPEKAQRILLKHFHKPGSTLVCSHRPVMPTLLSALRTVLPKNLAAFLPSQDPYLVPGEVIIIHRATDAQQSWKPVAVEIHRPFED